MLAAGTPDTTLLARAESLLVQGRLPEARRLLEQADRHTPDDPDILMLLGRVHLEWPVVGRFKAWRLFDRAAELRPDDPEPRYQQMRVGLRLGGADGERLTRDAILRVLAILPEYRDVWDTWRSLYRGPGHRRRAVAVLAAYRDPVATHRLAALWIELEAYAEADSALATLTARDPGDPGPWALRAQAALERGDTAAGVAHYDRAVAAAARDTAQVLWRQIAPIASPREEGEYAVATPQSRPAFFRAFWARRDPDLTTPVNERLVEHFARLRRARRDFPLLHPTSRFHEAPSWRTLQGAVAGTVLQQSREFFSGSQVIPGRSVFEDELQELGLGVDVRDLPEPEPITRYRRLGFDGRGLIYVRFGRPDHRYVAPRGGDVEGWRYRVDRRTVTVIFARATAAASFRGGPLMGGDFVVYPTSLRELHNAALMLERDESSIRADRRLAAWVAFFRAADATAAAAGLQDVLLGIAADTAAVAAWDPQDREVARTHGPTPLTITLRHGRYRFGADARVDGALGRLRGSMDVPALAPGWLAVSSLLAAVTSEPTPDRQAMARHMPADVVLRRGGRPLTLFAEVYDLPDADGVARYEAHYTFEPVGGGPSVTFAFPRTVPAGVVVIERLLVEPGQVPPGAYRITLRVRDHVLGLTAPAVTLLITLR
ncbi:MAG: GWxTD domain-containing protein [Gemmatimonadota bacterium]|nr:GWxTD domain-containing protein [Gemmatimonadota bacterium]